MAPSRKKVDNRIRTLIDSGVEHGHRSMFVIVGDKGRDQTVILHHMLSKARVQARPNVLWCYKKELGFTSHRKKRMRHLQKKIQSGKVDVNEDDPFELFVASTNIRYCYYSETHKILGNTYGMCILQDFEALTPNLLARTIETVEGGGLVVILLKSMTSLKQLYSMTMDVHSRFRTEAHQDVVGRFNERFILSLGSCGRCIVMNDNLDILPLTNLTDFTEPVNASFDVDKLNDLKASLKETQPVGVLIDCCRTYDQAQALLEFINAVTEKRLDATVSLTAARGRGKSAALGLAMSAAIAFGYSNIYVTSPSPENLKTLFEFVFKGFDVLQYKEHSDYEIVQSTNPDFNKAIVRVSFFRDHRQTIQYIHPSDAVKLGQAELLVIDEAAAIPLPLVKSLFGPYLIFLSSTISGYEGTGRSLSLKLLQQLRTSAAKPDKSNVGSTSLNNRTLKEVTLEESIRYKPGDDVENWLINMLCLDAKLPQKEDKGIPLPDACDLYYINRDTLFSFHKASEVFLQNVMYLYVSSHYKNSPNDLQLMSDAPAHHLFCLLGPVDPNKKCLPDVYCVIQVCMEGEISASSVKAGLQRGQRASGDLIPWTMAQQYNDDSFACLSGARVVRIAVHPDYQDMGYGTRAMRLLEEYFEGKIVDISEESDVEETENNLNAEEDNSEFLLHEKIEPKSKLPPLFLKLTERKAEQLHYIGVSYGVTQPLLKFWRKLGYVPVYLRQTPNELTGEHTCIMLKTLNSHLYSDTNWLCEFFTDFRRRFISLLAYQFRSFAPVLAMSILQNKAVNYKDSVTPASVEELKSHLTLFDIARLEKYVKNMSDYHVIMDLVPTISKLYFLHKFGTTEVSAVQAAILIGLGLQHKTVEDLATQLDLPVNQVLGLFNRGIKRLLEVINNMLIASVDSETTKASSVTPQLKPLAISLQDELQKAEKEMKKQQNQEIEKFKESDLMEYSIKGTEDVWNDALSKVHLPKGSISIKSGEKRLSESSEKEGVNKKRKFESKKNKHK